MSKDVKKDFSKEFGQKRKHILFYFVIQLIGGVIGPAIILPILFFLIEFGETFFFYFILTCLTILIIGFVGFVKHAKCPNCKKFPGQLTKFCSVCGVKLKN